MGGRMTSQAIVKAGRVPPMISWSPISGHMARSLSSKHSHFSDITIVKSLYSG